MHRYPLAAAGAVLPLVRISPRDTADQSQLMLPALIIKWDTAARAADAPRTRTRAAANAPSANFHNHGEIW